MAISDSQKVDYLYKKLGFGVGKTDTSAVKSPSNESIASPLLIRGDTVWVYSSLIPGTAPTSSSPIVNVYAGTTSIQSVNDGTSSTNRTWLTNLGDWIGSEFGATYQPKVWAAPSGTANAAATGTRLFPDGSGNNDAWFFDPQAGILNFSDTNVPTAVAGNVVFIEGYRYIGAKGLTTALGNITFSGSNISTNAVNANLTFSANGAGSIVASGNLVATGNVTGSYHIGNGSTLTNITGANVTGTVANTTYALQAGQSNNANTAIYVSGLTGTNVNVALGYVPLDSNATALTAQYVTQAAQANITSVGVLTGLTLSGTLNGTAIQAATIGNATTTFTGVTYTASGSFNGPHNGTLGIAGGNTAIVSTLSATGAAAVNSLQVNNAATVGTTLTVGGLTTINSFYANTNSTVGANLTILGNLIVSGNVITSGSNNVSFTDSIIELHTLPNLANLTYDDGKDIGIRFHFYKTQNDDAFLGWANDTGFLEWYGRAASETGNVIEGVYGTIKSGALILANSTPSTGLNTGALQSNGGASFSGNIYANGIAYLGSSTAIALTNPLLVATTSANTYTQIQVQNQSNGSAASSDFIATADDGTDTTRYIDMGINGSGWNQATWTVSGARDGYLYTSGVNLTIGTDTVGKTLKIHTGGLLAACVVATFSDADTVSTSSTTGALTLTGGLGVSGAVNGGSTLGIASNATVNALTVNNSATIGTTLGVVGNITGSSLTLSGSEVITGSSQIKGGLQATPIGNATASTGQFTTVNATSTISALGGIQNTPIGNATASTGQFTTVSATGNVTAAAITSNGSITSGTTLNAAGGIQNTPIGNATASTGQFTTLSATGNVTAADITSNGSITTGTTLNAAGGIQNTPIGNLTPSTALFTTIGTSSNATVNGLTVNASTTIGSTLGVAGNLTLTANLIQTGVNNFTAYSTTANALSAGTVQANAYAIVSTNTQFTSVGAGSAAILPIAPAPGTLMIIANDGLNSLLLYPPVGGYIDQAAVNAPIIISAGGMWSGVSLSTSVWTSVSPDTQGTANQITVTQGNGTVVLSLPSVVTAPGTLSATGGIQNTPIGNVTPSTALFTTIGTSGTATVAALTVNGTATVGSTLGVTGNVTAPYFIGNIIGNISGNIAAPGANTQILFNDAGTVNGDAGLTYNKVTDVLVAGIINAATFGNAGSTHIGNGAALTSLTGANVTGTVANATYALQAGQSNYANTATYVTGLTGTNVNVALGYVPLNSNATALTAQYVTQAAQANITSVGVLTGLTLSGTLTGTTIQAATIGNASAAHIGNGAALTSITGANVTGTVANAAYTLQSGQSNYANTATYVTGLTGTNVNVALGYVPLNSNATALTAQYVTQAAQANITSVGVLTSLNTSGNTTVNALTVNNSVTIGTTLGVTGNVAASYFIGNGSALTGINSGNITGTVANAAYALQSGQSNYANTATYVTGLTGTNVNVALGYVPLNSNATALTAQYVTQAAQANITSVGTLTGLTLSGTLTGTTVQAATIGNANAVLIGNGASLTSITGANVTGTVANATYALQASQTNNANTATTATYVTGLTGTNVNVALGYVPLNSNATALTAQYVTQAAQANITSVGTLTGLTLSGTLTGTTLQAATIGNTGAAHIGSTLTISGNAVVGNLDVLGNVTYINSTVTDILDPILELNTAANGAPLSGNAPYDSGIKTHYWDGSADRQSFFGRTNDTGNFEFYSNVTSETGNVVTGTYGTIKSGNIVLTGTGSVASTLAVGANATVNGLAVNTSATVTGSLNAAGGLQATPIGNVTPSTALFTTVGVSGNVTISALTVNTSATVGTTLGVTGNITGGNANIVGTTASTSKTTGALKVAGGAGVAGDLYAGNSIVVDGGAYGNVTTTQFAAVFAAAGGPNPYSVMQVRSSDNVSGLGMWAATGLGILYGNTAITFATGATIRDRDVPSGGTTRAVLDSTGLAVTGIVSASGNVTAAALTSNASITAATTLSALGGIQNTPIGNVTPSTALFTTVDASGNATVSALTVNASATIGTTLGVTGNVIVGNLTTAGLIKTTATTAATSNVTGAVQVSGGVGVAGNVYVGQRVGWVAANSVSAVYQIYNAATNSLDTVFE